MGVRFAFSGGREGWMRVLLTAVGVGLGVALLLLTTAIPSALSTRGERSHDRASIMYVNTGLTKADDTLIVAKADTTFRAEEIYGRELNPEGPRAPLPPGIDEFPAVGEMLVSPALERLLKSADGKLLRERLPDRIVGTIGDSGLVGPAELAFYRGADDLAEHLSSGTVTRIDRFGELLETSEAMDPILLLLTLVIFVVLLMPVGVFIATAVRFGGERRDRRLAALRLVGADGAMTRRMAAGEAFAGAAVGLVLGAVFFLIGRQAAGHITVLDISVFPSDLNPAPALALLVAVAVPVAAVLVTLFALRGVVIEPLGVVRTARPPRRRLWWRLLLPLGGVAALYPMIGQGRSGKFNDALVITGVTLLLVGVTALLPWVIEAVVARLGSGGLSWQLAVRRLQLSSGTAARMVNGIAVAVAGAIALQMFFTGVSVGYTTDSDQDLSRAQMELTPSDGVPLVATGRRLAETEGVRKVTVLTPATASEKAKDPQEFIEVTVGDCAALRDVGRLPSCRDGDSFVVRGGETYDRDSPELLKPGSTLYVSASYDWGEHPPVAWTVPGNIQQAGMIEDPAGVERGGILATPGALPKEIMANSSGVIYIGLDPKVADARDLVRNATARIDRLGEPMTWTETNRAKRFDSIRTGLFVGSACVLLLIGISLLVSQLEQLRERRKLLSSLVAFGTRRRTLSLSVLWQTAIPIGLGLLPASGVGLTLGVVLLKMTRTSVHVDWTAVLSMTGIGAGVVLLVTLLSLPPLLRLMRADGLRTE
ncbi:FtsX-like permease family protein [Streptomyces sp. NPDC002680]|uniref:FtsX-like permease family protein n=1 Tax=Streptomyces sp. NPDC002680 TaxID=3364659 RepID=UPI0036B6C6AC